MSEKIVCKPTPWFLLRAGAMVLMFGVFAVLFFIDGSTGYREKNISYYSWKGVEAAVAEFAVKKDGMSPAEWEAYAAGQEIELPEDRTILPEDTPQRLGWPSLLRDYEAMQAGMANPKTALFEPSMDELGLTKSAPEKPLDAGKIFEQWVVFWICLALTLAAVAVLLRTMSRKMVLEGDDFQPAGGKALKVSDLVRLDLRRWGTKGLAYAWAKEGEGERKIRIDGLTYGGFKAEDGQPAEKLMQALKARFSGEIIDYESGEGEPTEPAPIKV